MKVINYMNEKENKFIETLVESKKSKTAQLMVLS